MFTRIIRNANPKAGDRAGVLTRNVIFNTGAYLVAVVTSIAVTPLLVRFLGLDAYGAFVLISGLIGYYSLLDFGLGQGLTRHVAECRARGDVGEASGPILVTVAIHLVVGLLAALPVFIYAWQIAGWLNLPETVIESAAFAIRIGAFGFLGSMVSGTIAAALVGLERYDVTAKIESISVVTQNTVIVLFLLNGGGLIEAVSVSVIVTGIALCVYVVMCVRLIPSVFNPGSLDRRVLYQLGSFSAYMFIAKLSNVFSVHGIRIFISWQLGPSAVALYTVPTKLLAAFGGILSSGSAVLFPFASGLGEAASSEMENIARRLSKGFAAVSIPGFLVLAGCSYPILSLWIDRSFAENAWIILSLMSLSNLIASQSTVVNQLVSGRGHSRLLGLFGLSALSSYIIFIPLFSSIWGLVGIVIGILVTSTINLMLVLWRALPVLGLSVPDYMRSVYAPHAGMLAGGVALVIPVALLSKEWSILASVVFVLFVVYHMNRIYTSDSGIRQQIRRVLGQGPRV